MDRIAAAARLRTGAVAVLASAILQTPANAQQSAEAVPPRLYIHLNNDSQRPAAQAIRVALRGRRVAGQQLVTLDPRIDAPRSINRPQLRCVTRADCAKAGEVAALLGSVLTVPPAVVDLSARYNGVTGTRASHYELWFGPTAIPLRNALPDAGSQTTPGPAPDPTAGQELPVQPVPISPPRTVSYVMSRPAAVGDGDIVSFGLTFTPAFASQPNYSATVDGMPAAVRTSADGIEVIVPRVAANMFSRRMVPIEIGINGGRIESAPMVAIKATLENPYFLGIILAVLAGIVWLGWVVRRKVVASLETRLRPDLWTDIKSGYGDLQDKGAPQTSQSRAFPLPEPPEALVFSCAHAEGLLFLGGDVASLAGLPAHATVLGRLLDEAPALHARHRDEGLALLARGDVDTVIDLLAQTMGREALVSAVSRSYAQLKPPGEFLELLPHIGFTGAITSSFARTMEMAWPDALQLTPRSNYDFSALMRERKPFVLRLRGDLDELASVVLTSVELGRAIDEAHGLRSTLNALFAERTILFLGMTPSSLSTALEMAGIRGAAGQRHYALIVDEAGFDISADRFARQYGIEFVRIGGHVDVLAFLSRLSSRVAAVRRGQSSSPLAAAEVEHPALAHLRLENIGPFEELDVEFRNQWTMLLGNNGAGKSTILRAIALALSGDDSLVLEPGLPLLRRGASRGIIELTVSTSRSQIKYMSALTRVQGRLAISANTAPLQSGTIAAFGFPAVRGVGASGKVEFDRGEGFPHPRVADVLPIIAGGSDDRGKSLKQWIFRAYLRSLEQSLPAEQRQKSRAMIDSLFRLLDSMTPGFELSFSRCDPDTSEILLNTSDGEVPIDYISQGMSATIGWIGPMIQRLYEINGDDSSPEGQHAILLIDEIDSHLHPAWQQKLVGSLKQHFPNVQVIATTHSPLMVGNLGENEVLRVLRRDGKLSVDYLEQSFIGYRFDQILTDEAFGLARARSEDWKAREQYVALLGKSHRTPEEEAEFERLTEEMRKLPGPAETPAERRAAIEGERELQDAIRMAGEAGSRDGAGADKASEPR